MTTLPLGEEIPKSSCHPSGFSVTILRFFSLISSDISLQENTPVCPNSSEKINDLVEEIKLLNKSHRIISILSGINLAIDYTQKNTKNKSNYYLLILDYSTKKVRIAEFKPSQLEAATKAYGNLEKETDKNVVLVSAKSFNELREAYPNYFVDISEFINMIQKIMKDY